MKKICYKYFWEIISLSNFSFKRILESLSIKNIIQHFLREF